MQDLWEGLRDNDSVGGRAATSAVVILVGIAAAFVAGRVVSRRFDDPFGRYYAKKVAHYSIGLLAMIVLAVTWRAFAGRAAVVLGLATAGVAFAMQEVIGALAGWFNILSGRIFRVGDRIQMGGVHGDVIDVTPLRTKIMEIGSATDDASWVRGRQYTGRIVAVSNKTTFTDPVYNYNAVFDFIWEELTLPIPYDTDDSSGRDTWREAEGVLREELERVVPASDARRTLDEMVRRYPVPRTEVQPTVFVRATDDWIELSARFPVPVRSARSVKDDLTRRVLERLGALGIRVASRTQDVRVTGSPGPPSPGRRSPGSR